jgi:hypothetical protein
MSTSRASWLTIPQGDAKVSEGIFGYLTARVRQRAYDIVIREFKRSGLNKAQLARRWGKDPALVTRFLARPGNWEIDTYTEALFAISGAVPQLSVGYAQNMQTTEEAAPPRQLDAKLTGSRKTPAPFSKVNVNNPDIRLDTEWQAAA